MTTGSDEGGRIVEPGETPRPGDILPSGGYEPIVGKASDTPLADDEPEGIIPANPLWAMKTHRHVHWHLLPQHDRHDRIRDVLGGGDDTVYVVDDGRHHVTIGRRVGSAPDGAQYCLVGRIAIEEYGALRQGAANPHDAFDTADELTLCGVVAEDEALTGETFDVARYGGVDEVPSDFLPGNAFITFPEDLDIEY